jgi:regulator of replication initiation timing
MDHVIELRKRVSDLERQVSNLTDANVELWKQNKGLRAELLQQTEEQNDWAGLQNRRYSEYTE